MTTIPPYSLKNIVFYFLKLGTIGFGGPVALVGYMQRDLVENKKWITDEEYKEGLALSQLAPGPFAAQLGIYLGFVHYGFLGATLAGLAFVRSVKAFVEGITAAVIGALAGAALIIASRSVIDLVTALIALCTIFSLMYFKRIQEPLIILVAGMIGLGVK